MYICMNVLHMQVVQLFSLACYFHISVNIRITLTVIIIVKNALRQQQFARNTPAMQTFNAPFHFIWCLQQHMHALDFFWAPQKKVPRPTRFALCQFAVTVYKSAHFAVEIIPSTQAAFTKQSVALGAHTILRLRNAMKLAY